MPPMPPSSRIPWVLALLLALGNLVLAARTPAPLARTTYVLTPLVDVVPGTVHLSEEEGQALRLDLREQAEARDMQQAYAWLGATLSFDDLLRLLEASPDSLDEDRRAELSRILEGARADRQELLQVQRRILELEGRLAGEAAALRGRLEPR